ncbi:MAG: hypothetical protein U0168_15400 [Nannocystaceae bacterium]
MVTASSETPASRWAAAAAAAASKRAHNSGCAVPSAARASQTWVGIVTSTAAAASGIAATRRSIPARAAASRARNRSRSAVPTPASVSAADTVVGSMRRDNATSIPAA